MNTNGETRNEQFTMAAIQNISDTLSKMQKEQPTLRDQFAMSVMSVWSGGSWNGTPLSMCEEGKYDMIDKLARNAYKVADAMLRAREN